MSARVRVGAARGCVPPRLWTRQAVRLSTGLLPAGEVRLRYRQELLAEMYAMTRAEQTAHGISVIVHALSLRAAVTSDEPCLAPGAHRGRRAVPALCPVRQGRPREPVQAELPGRHVAAACAVAAT